MRQSATQPEPTPSRALPPWVKGAITLGMALALLVAFMTRTLGQRGDWSDGLGAVALTAGLLALLTLLFAGMRALAGQRTRQAKAQKAQALLLILLLLAIVVGATVTGPSLHAVQARAAVQRSQWPEAVEEFALSGERAPNAPGIAGAYVAWGEQLLAAKNYSAASVKLAAVATRYVASGQAVVERARHDLYRTYNEWMRANPGDVSYGGDGGALATFQQYLNDPACDAACQTQLAATLALAHFQYGQQLMASQEYSGAKLEYETVASQYATSPYASQAHAAAARAYFELGRQQIASPACSDAIATYQTLVAYYAETPEAAQAKTALAAPQPVSGTLSGMPTNPAPVVALSKHVNVSSYLFSSDYTVKPDASGAFTVPGVAQGSYNLSTKRTVNNAVSYTYYRDAKGNPYTVHVGPLCPVELGAIAY